MYFYIPFYKDYFLKNVHGQSLRGKIDSTSLFKNMCKSRREIRNYKWRNLATEYNNRNTN